MLVFVEGGEGVKPENPEGGEGGEGGKPESPEGGEGGEGGKPENPEKTLGARRLNQQQTQLHRDLLEASVLIVFAPSLLSTYIVI